MDPVAHKTFSHQANHNCGTLGIATLDWRDSFLCSGGSDRKDTQGGPCQLLAFYYPLAFRFRVVTGQTSAKGVMGLCLEHSVGLWWARQG